MRHGAALGKTEKVFAQAYAVKIDNQRALLDFGMLFGKRPRALHVLFFVIKENERAFFLFFIYSVLLSPTTRVLNGYFTKTYFPRNKVHFIIKNALELL